MVTQQPFNEPRICRQVRSHVASRPLENGWVILHDRNYSGNTVYLVSQYRDVGIVFKHDEPYHDHLRAICYASAHAENNVETAPESNAELVVQPLFPAAQ